MYHVPRKALGGSTFADFQVITGTSLGFYGPNADLGYDENSDDPKRNFGISVLLTVSNGGWMRPCYGFDDRNTCFGHAETMFFQNLLWCRSGPPPTKWQIPKHDMVESYAARWRRVCKPRVDIVWNEEMQMKGSYASGVEGVFFEGAPEFPDRWIECEHDYNEIIKEDRGTCKSGFSFYDADGVLYARLPYAFYYVPLSLATSHKSIHHNITKKMNSYVLYSRASQEKQAK